MSEAETGQVSSKAAEVYEEFFVPALFGEWAGHVADAVDVSGAKSILDVACGTGVLARTISSRATSDCSVVGLDRNEGMLDVARRSLPSVEWKLGQAEDLPFADNTFDVVVSQFGLMFFEDRNAALSEMWRVLKPGGRMAIAVWDKLDAVPGYAVMTDLLVRMFGEKVRDACESPFILGEVDPLLDMFGKAGIEGASIQTGDGTVTFPSIEAWVHTDVKGWTLADVIDDDQYQDLLREAKVELKQFAKADGSVAFPSSAHIVTADKA